MKTYTTATNSFTYFTQDFKYIKKWTDDEMIDLEFFEDATQNFCADVKKVAVGVWVIDTCYVGKKLIKETDDFTEIFDMLYGSETGIPHGSVNIWFDSDDSVNLEFTENMPDDIKKKAYKIIQDNFYFKFIDEA